MSTKTVKEYYQNPEFKKRQLDYSKTKIECLDCGHLTARSNMTKHKKGRIHKETILKKEISDANNRKISDLVDMRVKKILGDYVQQKDIK